jgi:hypothetical protein
VAAARYIVLRRTAACLPGIMVWVYEHTESLLLAQRLHACYAGSLLILSSSMTLEGSMLWKMSFATALWVIVGLFARTHRKTVMWHRLQARAISG